MYNENDNIKNTGNINISEEVIAVVAGVAATEIKGVIGMCTTLTGGLIDLLGKKNYSKGVKVEISENNVKISMSITVEFGCKIPDVAMEVQEKVKREVENMTSMNVETVDVYVNAIALPKVDASKTEEDNK